MQTTWCVLVTLLLVNLAQQATTSLPPPVCSPESKCEEDRTHSDSKNYFKVNDTQLSIEVHVRQLILECLTDGAPLDVGALPSFSSERAVDELFLFGCALGHARVLDVLRALNARVDVKLQLERITEPLHATLLEGLHVRKLHLQTFDPYRTRVDGDFFAALADDTSLSTLWTSGVEYDAPPSGLEKWSSTNGNFSRLPRGVLSTLKEIYLIEPRLSDVSALEEAVGLRNLSVTGIVRGALPRLPALRTVFTQGWRGLERAPLASAELESLTVIDAGELRPTPDWLAGCSRLTKLVLSWSPVRELPRELLRHARSLRELTIYSAELTSDRLPDDLLEHNTEITVINLSHNKLTSVPSEVFFKRVEKLSELDLSWNHLVRPADWFPALPSLRTLKLGYNPLGDSCPELGTADVTSSQNSWLQQLTSLQTLSLAHTGAARLCVDWLLRMPRLRTLDLTDNHITQLTYRDLHPVRSQRSQIVLQGNNITSIIYSAQDYSRSKNAAHSDTKFLLNASAKLHCDCHMYWFAMALRDYKDVEISSLMCGGTTSLFHVELEALSCGVECGERCACRAVPARGAALARTPLEADCEQLPQNDTLHPNYMLVTNLSLVGLGLESLPASERLPAGLVWLDLRNNSLRSAAGLRDLLQRPALRLLLAGNPIDCRCGSREFLDTLIEHKDRVVDFEELRCLDGKRAAPSMCGASAGLAALLALLGVLGVAAVLGAAAMAHPTPRAKLKVILHVLGVRLPGGGAAAGAGGAAWKYDAFVSFAETDAEFVAEKLAPALERARRPRRLCVHHRDWSVGELIVKQIERSVTEARRTVLVVSDAFARSQWARAEFEAAMSRAAADGRAPPLVVLLEPPSAAALAAAPELAHYLAAATYLRADDPRFEHKLRAAVPPSPAPDTAPAA